MTSNRQIPMLKKLAHKSLITHSLFKMNDDVIHPMVREEVMRQFLQAVMNDNSDLVKQLLDKHPELLVVKPIAYDEKEFVIESPYTWQRFDVEDKDALTIAVKRKQFKMIELLLSYYDKLEQTEAVMTAKTDALSKWSHYEMHNDEIVIPREYAAYLESLIDVFANETFPNGTAIDSPLGEQTEEALNWFRKITLPNKAVKLDDDALDPELFLYAFYKRYVNHFNRFQNWGQRDHFCIKVGGWIQSLLTPETAKIFCEGLYYVVEENRAINHRAESLKLLDGESFYRSSRDSLSALGGKYLCGGRAGEAVRGGAGEGWPLSMEKLCQTKAVNFRNFTQQPLQHNQLPASRKLLGCVIL
ncbi:MAG: hypothetical protein A3F11_04495 [Gammaproteobacteria bacterium RIFCSPHIGHO2_12_FULL_37_14]|nr:MAG: hypothetical protein A3F11_04495 [Gammaproteobacteria bacterium RIFCSPHIGHO2_12_FULL_37_14]